VPGSTAVDRPANKPANAHAGHRQRVREKVFAGGMKDMADHELIEFLLFYAIPKRDVNLLAHALLDEFGSLDRLFAADEEALVKVPGVGPGVAKVLTAFASALRLYLAPRDRAAPADLTPERAAEIAGARFVHPTRQEMAALSVSGGGALLNCAVRDWDIVREPESVRWLIEQTLNCGAHQLILVWKRYGPARRLTRAELEALNEIVVVLGGVEIRLIDLVLLHPDALISLRREKLLVEQAAPGTLALASDDGHGDFIVDSLPDEAEKT